MVKKLFLNFYLCFVSRVPGLDRQILELPELQWKTKWKTLVITVGDNTSFAHSKMRDTSMPAVQSSVKRSKRFGLRVPIATGSFARWKTEVCWTPHWSCASTSCPAQRWLRIIYAPSWVFPCARSCLAADQEAWFQAAHGIQCAGCAEYDARCENLDLEEKYQPEGGTEGLGWSMDLWKQWACLIADSNPFFVAWSVFLQENLRTTETNTGEPFYKGNWETQRITFCTEHDASCNPQQHQPNHLRVSKTLFSVEDSTITSRSSIDMVSSKSTKTNYIKRILFAALFGEISWGLTNWAFLSPLGRSTAYACLHSAGGVAWGLRSSCVVSFSFSGFALLNW